MTRPLRISRRAERQIERARAWWLEHRDKRPSAFDEDLPKALERIRDVPFAGKRVLGTRRREVRYFYLDRISYNIYYRIEDDFVEVVGFWHSARGTKPKL